MLTGIGQCEQQGALLGHIVKHGQNGHAKVLIGLDDVLQRLHAVKQTLAHGENHIVGALPGGAVVLVPLVVQPQFALEILADGI